MVNPAHLPNEDRIFRYIIDAEHSIAALTGSEHDIGSSEFQYSALLSAKSRLDCLLDHIESIRDEQRVLASRKVGF